MLLFLCSAATMLGLVMLILQMCLNSGYKSQWFRFCRGVEMYSSSLSMFFESFSTVIILLPSFQITTEVSTFRASSPLVVCLWWLLMLSETPLLTFMTTNNARYVIIVSWCQTNVLKYLLIVNTLCALSISNLQSLYSICRKSFKENVTW